MSTSKDISDRLTLQNDLTCVVLKLFLRLAAIMLCGICLHAATPYAHGQDTTEVCTLRSPQESGWVALMRSSHLTRVNATVNFIWTDQMYNAGVSRISSYTNPASTTVDLEHAYHTELDLAIRQAALQTAEQLVPELLPKAERIRPTFEPLSASIELVLHENGCIDHVFPRVTDHTVLPLIEAAAEGDIQKARQLIKNGESLDTKDEMGKTPLMLAASIPIGTRAIETLLNLGAKTELVDIQGRTALMIATENGDLPKVKLLAKNGASLTVTDYKGDTALISAASSPKTNKGLIEFLVQRGLPVDARNKNGLTALMIASWMHHEEAVDALVQQGAAVNLRDPFGRSALTYSSMSHDGIVRVERIAKLLKEAGAVD